MTQELWTSVDAYFVDELVDEDEALQAARVASRDADLPPIALSPNLGKLLYLWCKMLGARRVLEVGTLGGYSTIWLARGVPETGWMVTLELDPNHVEVARSNLQRAGVMDRVEIRLGLAAESLARLIDEGVEPFDLVFIDADKPNNPVYFERSLELCHPGSVIVVDNVVRGGAVADDASADPSIVAIRRMHEMMAAQPRVTATAVQTVGSKGYDGFTLAWVEPASAPAGA